MAGFTDRTSRNQAPCDARAGVNESRTKAWCRREERAAHAGRSGGQSVSHFRQLAPRICPVEFRNSRRRSAGAWFVLLLVLLGCGTEPSGSSVATSTEDHSAGVEPRRVWANGTVHLGSDPSLRRWAARTEVEADIVSGTAGVLGRDGNYLLYDLTATLQGREIVGDLIASPDHPAYQEERYSVHGSMRGVRLSGTIWTTDASGEWEGWWTSVSTAERTTTTLTASVVTANPDQVIWFDVAFDPGGRSISSIQNDIVISSPAVRIQECVINPDIEKDLSWAYLPDGSGIRAIVLSFTNTGPILTPEPLYRCAVTIPADLAPGSYAIYLAAASASDPLTNPKEVAVENGTITVNNYFGEKSSPNNDIHPPRWKDARG